MLQLSTFLLIKLLITLKKSVKRSLNFKTYLVLCAFTVVSNVAMSNVDLPRVKNCMSCHTVNRKLIGPAFKDVATKYANHPNQKEIEDQLVQKVMKGGSGAWGVVPMPANTQVNEKEARLLVKWILSLKKS